jgi:hypothetical protein
MATKYICRERVRTLKAQIGKLEKKIGDLETERVGHQNSQLQTDDETTLDLLRGLITALDGSLKSLYHSKREREDHLSYYDDMEEPKDD